MTKIPARKESSGDLKINYSKLQMTEAEIAAGAHREFVGGLWDAMGPHQLDFLKSQGLKPHHKFLDVGCGSFRAGQYLIEYLDPGNYYAIDAAMPIIQAGYDKELTDRLRARQPIENLRCTDRFNVDFGVKFDFAIAQSVFTHISLNLMRLCLWRVEKVLAPGGKFFATFFEGLPEFAIDHIDRRTKRSKFQERDVFWYYPEDMAWVAKDTNLKPVYIGDWQHPRNQRMYRYQA